jgi:adenylate kinase
MSASHPILAALNEASKKGIQTILLSNVPRGRPNLTLYEVGNMVKFMGAMDLNGMDRMEGRFPLFGAQDWKDFLTQAKKPRLVILGPPGSGKKTQGRFLAKHFGIPYISTGEILKMLAQEDSELGRKVKKGLRENKPLVNAFIITLIRERLMQPDTKDGFILEGFPRTLQQAEALDQVLSDLGIKLDTVISLEVHERIAALRLLNKGRLEGKSKEIQATIESRLFRFKGENLPLREYYQNRLLLTQIDEVQETFDIQDNIKRNQNRILQKVRDLLYAQNVSNPTAESAPNSEYFEMAA